MAFSEDLLAQRNKLQHEILALESSLGNDGNVVDLLSSDSDSAEESDDSGHEGEDAAHEDLESERQQIQREIEELERKLGADAALVDALTDSEQGSLTGGDDGEDSDGDLDLPQDLETCLQMNLVYQEVLKEKLAELDRLLNENREQQKDLEEQLSGPSYINPGLPHLKLFLGSFMKPYFKDKLTSLGPPANEETKERMAHGTKPCDERKIRRWEPWQKALLMNSVVTDTMKRMLQPKLSKMEYITAKMCKAEAAEKEELQKQITLLEKDIAHIRSLKEDQLYGDRHADHDWDKISNIDFEGFRQPEDLMRFWQNYLHPSINKSAWDQDEITQLEGIAKKHKGCHWDQIAETLGTGRTAFMCFQTYQRCITKRKREWTKEEDQVFRELVDKMRIGNFIPYTQISYFMEGRESAQLSYRWTCVLDPSIKKGPWTKEEDELLLNAVKKYGCKEWWKIRMEVPGRTDNSCRERYLDCLQADIKRGAWSDEEVELLKKLVAKYGVGKWSKIASEIPNRLDGQCLNKWKWIVHKAEGKGVKRAKRKKRSANYEPRMKRRRRREKALGEEVENDEYDFQTESDTSEDENERVPYLDSDGEQPEENVSSDEESKPEYVQPDMKEWIPACRNQQEHSAGNLRTTLVRLPNEAEERDTVRVRNTVLDKMGNLVKTYVGMTPPAIQKCNSSNEDAMILVYECDIKRLLICMRASVMEVIKRPKDKTGLSSCTNRDRDRNDETEDKSETENGQKRKPARKPGTSTQLNYDLMFAITPWIGNVVIPLPFNERRLCEADVVRKRAADVPLVKSSVFLFFLQALKVDADGCKKVIEARNDKVPLTPRLESRPYSAWTHAKSTESKKPSWPLQSPVFPELPQPAKIAIPPRYRPQRITKQEMKFTGQTIHATMILPQTLVVTQPNTDNKVGTSHNVVQGILPVLQLGTQDASKIPQPESGRETQSASCPSTSVSTTGPPTETLDVRTPKRKHKPTMKAQALMDDKKAKLSKKQAAKNQPKSSVTQTVALIPQTTAWILTPAGLMPVTEIQVQAPGIPDPKNQVMPNNVQIVFQPPVVVNQSSCVAPTKGLPDTKVPTSVAGSTGQLPSSETCCNQTKPVTPMNPMPSLVPVSSSPMATSQNITSIPTNSTAPNTNKSLPTPPNKGSLAVINASGPCLIKNASPTATATTDPLNLSTSNINKSQTVSSSEGSLKVINDAGPCLIKNAPPPETATRDPPNSSSPNIDKSQPVSSSEGSFAVVNAAGPCLLKNAPPTTIAKVTKVPLDSAQPINKSHRTSSTVGPVIPSYFLIPTFVPTTAVNGTSHSVPQSSFVNSPVRVSVGSLPANQLGVTPPASPMTSSGPILSQTVMQQVAPQAKKQTAERAATSSKPRPKQMTFDPSLMFFEQPAQVKTWLKGNDGITLPGLTDKMPYLPPFVSSITTLTTLLKGRDSLLKSAVQLLPEEHRNSSDEEAKIAAVRKMVSERFKNNQAYLLLKARFLSCFTLPAVLATINPRTESTDDLDQENNMDSLKSEQFGCNQ